MVLSGPFKYHALIFGMDLLTLDCNISALITNEVESFVTAKETRQ